MGIPFCCREELQLQPTRRPTQLRQNVVFRLYGILDIYRNSINYNRTIAIPLSIDQSVTKKFKELLRLGKF